MLLSAATEWTKTKRVAKLFPNLCFRSSSKASHPSQASRNNSLLKRFLLQLLKVNDNGGNCPQPTASGLWQLHPEVLVIMRVWYWFSSYLSHYSWGLHWGYLLLHAVRSSKCYFLFHYHRVSLPFFLPLSSIPAQLLPMAAFLANCIKTQAEPSITHTAALILPLAQKPRVSPNKTS